MIKESIHAFRSVQHFLTNEYLQFCLYLFSELKDLRQLIVPEVQADDVCGFLWEHLVNDVRNLSISLGRSEDEVLLAIHVVLSELVYRATNSKFINQFMIVIH